MLSNLAFFGATGGSAGSCLAAALKAGHTCKALARTPSKLENAMTEKGVSGLTLTSNLLIVLGDVRDLDAVKQTIAGAEFILSGVGAYPKFQMSLRMPFVLKDRTICADTSAIILKACQETSNRGKKPILLIISTAGVQAKGKPRAIPFVYLSFYYWLLADPHNDKEVMEENVREHMMLPESGQGIDSYVMVKPSILMDGKGKGVEAVRAGTEDHPPVGYMIDRTMVGEWIFQRLIKEGGAKGQWKDRSVTITY
ncbi:hypothetical protein LTR17_024337 [Elasticomyces elasticus]|nr:hypothetical protein LTR17_024337 [Elasticomyces elasticus]